MVKGEGEDGGGMEEGWGGGERKWAGVVKYRGVGIRGGSEEEEEWGGGEELRWGTRTGRGGRGSG